MSYYWSGPWHMMWGGPGWGLWWIFPLLMVLMTGACVYMMARMSRGHGQGDAGASAQRILSERFAKGEISREEFEEKKLVLGGKP